MAARGWEGKTVVITGAARGVGKEAALLMRDKGAHIHVLDSSAERLEQMAAASGQGMTFHRCDVSSPEDVAAAFGAAAAVDVLVNNAGIQRESAFMDITLDDWRRTLDVNLTGTFLCIQAALPKMGPGATILNVLSHTGRRTNLYPYAASKAAIFNLTQNLAIELGPRRISINGLAFGAIFSCRNAGWQNDPEAVRAARARSPLGLMPYPRDIAEQLVGFLENSAHMATGTLFDVSGGRSLR